MHIMVYQLVNDDAGGHSYYWDPETNAVSWTDPNEPPPAEAAAPAPTPTPTSTTTTTTAEWQLVPDEASGTAYYWNPATNEVSWTAPPDSAAPITTTTTAPPATPTAASSLPPALAAKLAQRGLVQPVAAAAPQLTRPSQPVPQPQPPSAPVAQPPLPPGWNEMRDPAGKPFWRHVASGQASWTRPSAQQQPRSAPAPSWSGAAGPAVGPVGPMARPAAPRPSPYGRGGGGGGGRGGAAAGGAAAGGRSRAEERGARARINSTRDPLDPASWDGYEVPPVGGWGGRAAGGGKGGAPAGAASAAPAKRSGPLPSPGEIMRMRQQQGL